ncbi:MAG: hypothetical protein L7T26_01270 [Pseudomonadales bacterium]|nr:hypothetical protein [Pseudomonadales bacterium]
MLQRLLLFLIFTCGVTDDQDRVPLWAINLSEQTQPATIMTDIYYEDQS